MLNRAATLFSYFCLALLVAAGTTGVLAQSGALVTIIGGNQQAVNVTDNALDVNVVGGGGSQVASITYADLTGYDGGTAFTVTGLVKFTFVGLVGATGITSTSGTTVLGLGTAGDSEAFSDQTLDGGRLEAGDVWSSFATDDYSTEASWSYVASDILLAPDTDDITGGSLTLYAIWEEVTPGATLEAATP